MLLLPALNIKKKEKIGRQFKPAAPTVLFKILLKNNHTPTVTPSAVSKLLIILKVKDQQ